MTKLYGEWQTDAYELPTASGGIVPKNERGNVEAPPFVNALPGGTVHIESSVAWVVCNPGLSCAGIFIECCPELHGSLPWLVMCWHLCYAALNCMEACHACCRAGLRSVGGSWYEISSLQHCYPLMVRV